jgi:hypothetical protein
MEHKVYNINDKYFLPRSYLSYSAANDFYYNRDRFRLKYYMGIESPVTPELTFGKRVGEIVEKVINTKENITEKTYSEYIHGGTTVLIPHGNVAEKELRFEVDGIPILGFIDSFLESTSTIFEMKTGKTPWTQGRVDKHFQLDVYSLGVETIFGKVDDECVLVWLETRKMNKPRNGRSTHMADYDIELTGKVREFTRVITKDERAEAYNRIITTAQDISEDYTDWLASQRPRGGRA